MVDKNYMAMLDRYKTTLERIISAICVGGEEMPPDDGSPSHELAQSYLEERRKAEDKRKPFDKWCENWRSTMREAGACMSCLTSDPLSRGCADCAGTGWAGGAPKGYFRAPAPVREAPRPSSAGLTKPGGSTPIRAGASSPFEGEELVAPGTFSICFFEGLKEENARLRAENEKLNTGIKIYDPTSVGIYHNCYVRDLEIGRENLRKENAELKNSVSILQEKIGALTDNSAWHFVVGQRVEKFSGDYRAFGEVRAQFTMKRGIQRYVVEHEAEGGGSFLHIYSANNLRLTKE